MSPYFAAVFTSCDAAPPTPAIASAPAAARAVPYRAISFLPVLTMPAVRLVRFALTAGRRRWARRRGTVKARDAYGACAFRSRALSGTAPHVRGLNFNQRF